MHVANDTYYAHTYLRLQHYVSALWCRDKNVYNLNGAINAKIAQYMCVIPTNISIIVSQGNNSEIRQLVAAPSDCGDIICIMNGDLSCLPHFIGLHCEMIL